MKRAARSNERGDIEPCKEDLGWGSEPFKTHFTIDRDFIVTALQRTERAPGSMRANTPSRRIK